MLLQNETALSFNVPVWDGVNFDHFINGKKQNNISICNVK